jgi:hypothetical protein
MSNNYDASALPKTSDTRDPRWRAQNVMLIRLAYDGSVTQARRLEEKRSVVGDADDRDCFLLVRRGQHQPDVLWVDDLGEAREALDRP